MLLDKKKTKKKPKKKKTSTANWLLAFVAFSAADIIVTISQTDKCSLFM